MVPELWLPDLLTTVRESGSQWLVEWKEETVPLLLQVLVKLKDPTYVRGFFCLLGRG
jgi:hypothetical protein